MGRALIILAMYGHPLAMALLLHLCLESAHDGFHGRKLRHDTHILATCLALL